jgi:hypothetical protein
MEIAVGTKVSDLSSFKCCSAWSNECSFCNFQ